MEGGGRKVSKERRSVFAELAVDVGHFIATLAYSLLDLLLRPLEEKRSNLVRVAERSCMNAAFKRRAIERAAEDSTS